MKLIERLQSIGAYIDYPVVNVYHPKVLPRFKLWPDLPKYVHKFKGDLQGNEDIIFDQIIADIRRIIYHSDLGSDDSFLGWQNGIYHRQNLKNEDILILYKPPHSIIIEFDTDGDVDKTSIYYNLQVVQK